jgi:hypothetical protein
MVRKAGLGESEIEKAFRPEGVEPCAAQPQLEGSAGDLLTKARKARPGVPGHVRACEFVKSLDGMVLRAHGRFIDATLLLRSMDKKWVKFWESLSNKAFFGALLEKRNVSWSEMIIFGTPSNISNTSEVKDLRSICRQCLIHGIRAVKAGGAGKGRQWLVFAPCMLDPRR